MQRPPRPSPEEEAAYDAVYAKEEESLRKIIADSLALAPGKEIETLTEHVMFFGILSKALLQMAPPEAKAILVSAVVLRKAGVVDPEAQRNALMNTFFGD